MTSVSDWAAQVDNDDAYSVVESEFQDPAVLDRVAGLTVTEAVAEPEVEGFNDLQRAGVMMQRLVASELTRRYVRGRAHRDLPVTKPQPRVQRVVALEEMISLKTLDDPEFFSRLGSERVVARVQGATGIGKTRRLCGMIAVKCGVRVLQVELDANMAREAREAQTAEFGVRSSSVRWPRERQPFLSVLTYEDFNGYVWGRTKQAFFSSFEVMVLDEAHVPHWDVQCAIQFFANFAPPTCSLLVLSATVDEMDGPKVSRRVGSVKRLETPVSWRDMFDSGMFEREILRDRLLVLLPSDEAVGYAREHCLMIGVEVRALDTASVTRDVEDAKAFLAGPTSPTPRVLVAHAEHGTSYNFHTVFVVSSGTIVVQEVTADGSGMEQREVPLYDAEVVQHMGRVGRGLAASGGGLVLTSEVAPNKQMRFSEVAAYYVSLVAGDVKPRFAGMDVVEKWFPKGLSRDTARLLMVLSGRHRLPVYLAARYLAADGKVARMFHRALRAFAQPDAEMPLSEHVYPVGYESWVTDRVGGYFSGGVGDDELRVPFKPTPELRYIMHAISAMAHNMIVVPEWRAPADGDELSGEEDESVREVRARTQRKGYYRFVDEFEPKPAASSSASQGATWAYDVDVERQALRRKREGMSWMLTPRGEDAAEALRKRFLAAGSDDDNGLRYLKPEVRVCDAADTVKVETSDDDSKSTTVTARTPGGTEVIEIRSDTYRAMACGSVLRPESYVAILEVLQQARLVDAFVRSTVFDGWNPVWTSLWATPATVAVARATVDAGLHSTAILLARKMYDRFREEALYWFRKSNLYRKPLEGFFSKSVSINKLAEYVRKGRAPIAQSDRFVDRWLRMLDLYHSVLTSFEKAGVYDPLSVAATQQSLPIDVDGKKAKKYVRNPG